MHANTKPALTVDFLLKPIRTTSILFQSPKHPARDRVRLAIYFSLDVSA